MDFSCEESCARHRGACPSSEHHIEPKRCSIMRKRLIRHMPCPPKLKATLCSPPIQQEGVSARSIQTEANPQTLRINSSYPLEPDPARMRLRPTGREETDWGSEATFKGWVGQCLGGTGHTVWIIWMPPRNFEQTDHSRVEA